MYVHDRVVRAGLFEDADFECEFSRDERLFYAGLIMLADDSGCLLDNPREFKRHLFPLDEDVSTGTLQEWRDHFADAGKLVPYEACGKACLWMRNFNRHQSRRDSEAPSVPLPEWIAWQPYASEGRKGANGRGTFVVDDARATLVAPPAPKGCSSAPQVGTSPLERSGSGLGLGDGAEGECEGEPAAAPSLAAEASVAETPPATEDEAAAVRTLVAAPGYDLSPAATLAMLRDQSALWPDVDQRVQAFKFVAWWERRDREHPSRRRNWRLRWANWIEKAASGAPTRNGRARASPSRPAPGDLPDPDQLRAMIAAADAEEAALRAGSG